MELSQKLEIVFVGEIDGSNFKKFQEFAGLGQTGELDEPTKKKMAQPRCGVIDVLAVTRGGKIFSLDGSMCLNLQKF